MRNTERPNTLSGLIARRDELAKHQQKLCVAGRNVSVLARLGRRADHDGRGDRDQPHRSDGAHLDPANSVTAKLPIREAQASDPYLRV